MFFGVCDRPIARVLCVCIEFFVNVQYILKSLVYLIPLCETNKMEKKTPKNHILIEILFRDENDDSEMHSIVAST